MGRGVPQDFAKFFSGRCDVSVWGAGDIGHFRVSAACLPNFFKSRSNVSRSFFERTPATSSIAAACSRTRPTIAWPMQYLRAAPKGAQPRVPVDLKSFESCFEEQHGVPERCQRSARAESAGYDKKVPDPVDSGSCS